ncbi:MAG: PKD domain-containing protein [Candidatus Thiothrix putei]|uniref:PKD domain-containing protein n=1 Tax=Candidatus Thiothrix putei TaxID=3080811 RepID=A0AA95HFB1_9GAMM|nr:MAG: PKD domain-containing protein [Candidatus Thiothrix putei]
MNSPNFSHTFNAAGNYTVTLTVTDNLGATHTVSVGVTVHATNAVPVAVIKADTLSGTAPFRATFDGSASTDSDGAVADYRWDFGDGETAIGKTVSHTWNAVGEYTVTLTVTDNKGATGSSTAVVYVNPYANQPPVAKISLTPGSGVAPLSVMFDGSASIDPDGSIARYVWDFGDGSAGVEGMTTSHVYTVTGTYQVRLTVTDNHGSLHTESKSVTVSESLNLVENGSFEEHGVLDHGTWGLFKRIPGWMAGKGTLNIQRGDVFGITAIDGNDKLALDTVSNGTARTTVTTTSGQTYLLSFYYSPSSNSRQDTANAVDVIWNNVKLQSVRGNRKGWVKYSYLVQSTKPEAILRFVAQGDGDAGFIDDVRIVPANLSEENAINNGSFETYGTLNHGTWGVMQAIKGWLATQGQIMIQTGKIGGITASEGNAKLALESGNGSTVRYIVSKMEPDYQYLLSLDYVPRGKHETENQVEVIWNSKSLGILNQMHRTGWQRYYFERLAKSDKLSCSIFSIDRTPHIQPIFYSI